MLSAAEWHTLSMTRLLVQAACDLYAAYGPLVVVSTPDSFSILAQSLWEG